jgi:uncharacterized membrane protein YeaQ/YmgE (transglycosylase-associated protein family)
MEEQQIGWIAALIIGGIVGWLAEQFLDQFTNIQMGLVMNTVLGIAGAAVASWLLSLARRLDRLSDCWLHRSLRPNRDRPRAYRRSSAT